MEKKEEFKNIGQNEKVSDEVVVNSLKAEDTDTANMVNQSTQEITENTQGGTVEDVNKEEQANEEKRVVIDVNKLKALINSFKKEIAERDNKINELKDIATRLAADFDNYRKRVQKEKLEYIKFANKDLILDMLPVMDNFDRAIEAIEKVNLDGAAKEIFTGIKLVYKELESVLLKYGVERFSTEGKIFDPNINEVVEFSEVEIDEGEEGDFVEKEFIKPYKMHDQVIRQGKVKVVRKKKKKDGGTGSKAKDGGDLESSNST